MMKQFRFNRCTSRKGFENSCTISFFGVSLANGCMGKVTDNNQREPSFFFKNVYGCGVFRYLRAPRDATRFEFKAAQARILTIRIHFNKADGF